MNHRLIGLLIACITAAPACADWTYTDDRTAWEAAAGPYTTIGFTDYPDGTWIFEQYADLGVHFIDGADIVRYGPTTYPRDGYGLDGNAEIHLVFDAPMSSIAVDFPGYVQFDFYYDGQLIYDSPGFGNPGVGNFVGLASTEVFDEVVITDPFGSVFLDDLHFGPPIPAPPALALLALAAAASRRARRRR